MNNSDLPATAQSNDEICKAFMEIEQVAPNGLSKREAFAMAAMQGILSAGIDEMNVDIALAATLQADKLLLELSK